jgi:flagellar motor switch/type III secretory pathway protein FliN
MQEVAREKHLTLSQLEIFMLPPGAILATARNPEGPTEDAVTELLDRPFQDYIDWMLAEQFSGSCGATSGWLDQVTSRTTDAKACTLTEVSSGAFLSKMISEMIGNPGRWYCRCTLKVHSFFIEYIGRKACVYQSYFGHYSLTASIEGLVERNRLELLPLLEAAVHDDMQGMFAKLGTNEDWDELPEQERLSQERRYRSRWAIAKDKPFKTIDKDVYEGRKALFKNQAPVHDKPTVEYRLNTSPAPVDDIRRNIAASVARTQPAWKELLSSRKTVRELLDSL